MKRSHLLIAGTGRAGTSLLVKYLTEIGLETHLSIRQDEAGWDDEANAGLEDNILRGGGVAPYVVKSPWLFQSIDEVLASDAIKIDGVIIPVRDLAEAASSRTILELQNIHNNNHWFAEEHAPWQVWGTTPGGALYSLNPLDQARLLAVGFHHLVERLVTAGVPIYLLAFPRFTDEPEYLYQTLKECLPSSVTKERAIGAHAKVVDPQKVRVAKEIGGKILVAPEEAPSLEKVDNVALRREIAKSRKLHGEVEETTRHVYAAKQTLEKEVAALRSELEIAQRTITDQAKIIAMQESKLKDRQSEIDACNQKIEMLYSSTSWRITGPLRTLVKAIGSR